MFLALRTVQKENDGDQPDSEVGGVVCALPDDRIGDAEKWVVTRETGVFTAHIGLWPGTRTQAQVDRTLAKLRRQTGQEWTAVRKVVRQDVGKGARREYAWVYVPDLDAETLVGLLADLDDRGPPNLRGRRRFLVDAASFGAAHGARHFDPAAEVREADFPQMTVAALRDMLRDKRSAASPPDLETIREHGRERAAALVGSV